MMLCQLNPVRNLVFTYHGFGISNGVNNTTIFPANSFLWYGAGSRFCGKIFPPIKQTHKAGSRRLLLNHKGGKISLACQNMRPGQAKSKYQNDNAKCKIK